MTDVNLSMDAGGEAGPDLVPGEDAESPTEEPVTQAGEKEEA